MSRGQPWVVRLYRRSLALLPASFRRAHGPAMEAMLADAWADRSGLARAALLVSAGADLLWTAVLEHASAVRFSALDVRLGVRMLVRYPGLTIVGGLAMAFGIWVGASTFEFLTQFMRPTLPLAEGERVVGVRYWDRSTQRGSFPLEQDFAIWREHARSLEEVAAFRIVQRTIVAGDIASDPVSAAEMSAAGFRVARVPPLLGRYLTDEDEWPGAPPAVVLGYDVWLTRFGGDPGILGRTVTVGSGPATVIGVMPEGFLFPQNQQLWLPLTTRDAPLRVFGRLAQGVTVEEATSEFAALAAQAASESPERFRHLQAEVLPYVASLASRRPGVALRALLYHLNIYAVLFLVLVTANVALLMFARAAARESEILVRAALGASRGRILAQLFAEALVLSVIAAVVAIALTRPTLAWVYDTMALMGDGPLAFWHRPRVSPVTFIWAGMLTLLAAAVAGLVPALKITGKGMHARLRQAAAGAGGVRLGGIWTGVIVMQVAATVVFSGMAWVVARQAARSADPELNFPAEQYVGVRLELDHVERGRYAEYVGELQRRLADQPQVGSLTVAQRLPVKPHAPASVEVEDVPPPEGRSVHNIASGAVDPVYFDVLGAPILAGRNFDGRDFAGGTPVVIVNESFVQEVLGGRAAVGRRIRYIETPELDTEPPWHEIVGVARDLTAGRPRSLDLQDYARAARVFHPLDPATADVYPLHLILHARGAPGDLLPVLRATAAAVSPALQLHEPHTLDRTNHDLAAGWRLYANILALVSSIALLLALAGVYAVTSFTVARRTREIGVRVALGAQTSHVIRDIFRGPISQIAAGVLAGASLLGGVVWVVTGGRATMSAAAVLASCALAMLSVCAVACAGPVLRALRVEPAQALGSDA